MIERNLSERYRLEGRIGQGGMAVVYSGVDTVLRRRVAVKVLREQLAADADFVQRFYTEAQHAAKLSHPNIVNIYDVGREGENYFIVMELVDGATLGEMIEKDGALPEPVAIDFAAQICSGLAYAHRQGLLHRDVKPANILITKDDVVKLSDFGIARAVTTQTMTMTAPGLVMGSVYYLSPEQAQGHELRETSDLYSLGVVLYQMLTGKLPYTGESPVTVALKHVSSPIPSLDAEDVPISPALAAIVRKLLQKDPSDRFQSAVEVAKALREARDNPLVAVALESRRSRAGATASGPRTIPNPKPRPSRFPDRPAAIVEEEDDDRFEGHGRARSHRAVFYLAALVALAVAIAGGYLFANHVGIFGGPSSVALASVAGETAEEAERKLDAAGLRWNVVTVPSEEVAADRVVKQYPPAGPHVPAQTVVQLYVSNGLPTVELIDVRQYSSDDAQRYLRNAKLTPKITEVFDKSPRGTVLAERPAPGTAVPIHSTVALVVSKGVKPVYVPDVVSQTLGDAQHAIGERQLKLVVSERDPNDEIAPDIVTSQNPPPGSALDPGSTVSVVVSSGPPQIDVPDVEGRLANDAAGVLQGAGLRTNVEYLVDGSAPAGTVMKQDPEKPANLKKGSSVTLDVAVPGAIPDVVGKSLADATTALQNSGYKVGNTAYVQEGADGTVARTEPLAGTSLRPGETVMLFVNGTSLENP
jgi:beta-lactam-binding protein with PASTA domain/tRNA A-37 threonylcarbamoyl transferase component Bud32